MSSSNESSSVMNHSRPMKKRRLLHVEKNNVEGKKSFVQVGKMHGEQWCHENNAFDDRKKNGNEMETLNGDKKNILRVEPSTIPSKSHPKSETLQSIKSKLTAISDHSDACMNKIFPACPSDRGKTKELENSINKEKDIATPHGISRPRNDTINLSNTSTLSNLQSLLSNRVQVPSISDFLAQSQTASHPNTDLLASQTQLSAIPNVGIPQSSALDLLRQQEEQLALLRHLSIPNPMIDSLYREQIQLEQAKALLAGSQSSLHPLQQQAHIPSTHAPNIESLLTQQQHNILPAALYPLSQQAQLALLSSQLDPSSTNFGLLRACASILSQSRNNELDSSSTLPFQGNHVQPESSSDDATAALLMAYQQGKYQSRRKG